MTETSQEETTHWSEEKEVIKSNKPLKLVLWLLKIFPSFLVHTICYPVALFYVLFFPQVRKHAREYQKQLREYSHGQSPKKISAYRQILSFALCLIEKMEGWLGKVKFDRINLQNDDVDQLVERLKEGKSAILMASHLGNMELMRSMQDYVAGLCGRKVPVLIIMDLNVSANFSKTLSEVNSGYSMNVINASNFGPDSILLIEEQAEQGALIVAAGDRTSINNREKSITRDFLGRKADFPYGVFLIPALLKMPVYFMFGMREKMSIFNPKYNVHIEKSSADFNCPRSEREKQILACCSEFVTKLEKYCIRYPYQWYNFFEFWG